MRKLLSNVTPHLGSINHTLLTIEALKSRQINVLGLVFNGPENNYTEDFISSYGALPVLGRIQEENIINSKVIEKYHRLWKENPCWKQIIG